MMPSRPLQKICILGPAHPYRGGIATFNERLACELLHHQKEVFFLNYRIQYPSFLFPGKTQFRKTPPLCPEIPSLRILNSVQPLTWLRAGNIIRHKKADLILCKFWLPFLAPATGTAIRWSGVPALAIIDNIIPHERRWMDTPLIRYFLQSLHGAITMSQPVYEQTLALLERWNLRGRLPVRNLFHPLYDIYPSPIPEIEARQRLGIPSEGFYLLFFGLIRRYKGLDILLDALAGLNPSAYPNLHLLIAGEFYENPEPYLRRIQNHPFRERIHLQAEYIPDDQVNLWFSACNVVVQPYRHATQSGITQMALYYGKPVLSTRTGGLTDQILPERTGWLVEPDMDALRKKIAEIYHLPQEKFVQMKEEIVRFRERFSWREYVEKLLAFAGEVLDVYRCHFDTNN